MYRATPTLFDRLQGLLTFASPKDDGPGGPSTPKPRVLVVGYGWGGKAFSDNIDRAKYDVHILTAKPFFLNTPKMVESIVTWNNSLVRKKISAPNVHFGTLTGVLPGQNKIEYTTSQSPGFPKTLKPFNYDYLILAVGSVPNTFGIPGADTCRFLKTFDNMALLRGELEDARNDNSIVNIIGAGTTGVELALSLTGDGHRVRLIEAAPGILGGFSEETKTLVEKELKAYKVDLKLNTKIVGFDKDFILAEGGASKVIERGVDIWTSGVKPSSALDGFTGGGRLNVDKLLKITGRENIYAIGDIVAGPGMGPPTAQNAKAQGIFLAKHFNEDFREEGGGGGYKYIEKGRIIHGAGAIYVEYGGRTWSIPRGLGFLVDWIVGTDS